MTKRRVLLVAGHAMLAGGICFALAGAENMANWAGGVALGMFISCWLVDE